jgi:hypothetical protein
MIMAKLTEQLAFAEAECERLRKLAHQAPLNPYRLDADGHRWVEQQSSAWRSRGNDWIQACIIRDRIKSALAVIPEQRGSGGQRS